MLPPMNKKDRIVLAKLFQSSPREMRSDVTNFYFSEMFTYVDLCQVWRTSIMGETRGGKSEVGLTNNLVYIKRFNSNLNDGKYDSLDLGSAIKLKKLRFTVDHILGSQSDYIYKLRELAKTKSLIFGQNWQIDEQRDNIGGLGSFSESIDMNNLNNIIAKYCQSETWITPQKFESRNTPYGLYVYKKDIDNRVNWCLLYKITMNARYSRDFNVMGWIRIPLHEDIKLRKDYERKKNDWIQSELQGAGNKRVNERQKIAELLATDKIFSARSETGKTFKFSKEQQVAILERWISDGKTQNWNEMEKYRIVDEARMINELKVMGQ